MWLIIISFSLSACNNEKIKSGYQYEFNLTQVADSNPHVTKITDGEGFNGKVLKIFPNGENRNITLWKKGDAGSWNEADYLVVEGWHKNNHCCYLMWSFYGTSDNKEEIIFQGEEGKRPSITDERPRITTKIGVLPRLKTRVIYPLRYLNGQTVFGQRFPRQLKTNTGGKRLEPENMTKVVVRIDPYMEPRFTPEFEIAAIYLTDSLPEPYEKLKEPYVDEFGQWALKDWPGKTHSLEQLKELNDSLLRSVPASAETAEWSKYGGWKKIKFNASGFFHTHHDGKRWWLVDPEGYAFLSVGVDAIRCIIEGYVSGQEDLYVWLPEQKQSQEGRMRNRRMVDFYTENLKKVFGEEYKKNWETITSGLMRQNSFNTVGNWSDIDFARNKKLPYVFPMNDFPSTDTLLYRDFPDVFSPKYAERSEVFAEQMIKFKNDTFLIGYFLRNEPTWAFGFNNIAFEMFAVSTPSYTKKEFIKWIKTRYKNDPESFSNAWGIELKDFNDLMGKTFRSFPGKAAEDDFLAFSGIMVRKYVDVPCDAIEKIDPNHLNLGLRYGTLSSDLLYNASDRFDVFSINSYGRDPAETKEIAAKSGKPVMIGEFHFGALDRGLPATGLGATLDQADRGKAYQHYIETGFARPELVAIHWFTLLDQPVTGRFDGENYNIGLVDICNRPYKELLKAASVSNKRIYEVATGKFKPAPDDYERVPLVR